MDRRKLVVGGSATALVATLAALPGGGVLPAAASTPTTADHARLVLDHVNAELGVVNPEGLDRIIAETVQALPNDGGRTNPSATRAKVSS